MKKLLLVLLTILLLCGCSKSDEETIYTSSADFEGKRISVLASSVHEARLNEFIPNAQKIIVNSTSELLISIKTNKADGFVLDEPSIRMFASDDDEIDYFIIPNSEIPAGFIFSDDSDVLEDFNNYLRKAKGSGYIDYLEEKWIMNDSIDCNTEIKEYTPTKRKISVVTVDDQPPYSYQKDGRIQGFSIELLYDFGYETGYEIELSGTTIDGIISGVTSGKFEMGATDLSMTEERMKNMRFSDPIHSAFAAVVYYKKNPKVLEFTELSELNDKTFGCIFESAFAKTIEENFKDANIVYFNSRSELIMALEQGRIDCYVADEPVALLYTTENDEIGYIKDSIETSEYGICFSNKASLVREQFNNFLEDITSTGEISKLQEKWFTADSMNKKVEEIELTGENGVLKCVTTTDSAPFSFLKDNKYEGYEVELLTLFAKEYGYSLDIEASTFDVLLPSIEHDQYDIAFNGISINEERKSAVDFSNPIYSTGVVAVVRNTTLKSKGFFGSLRDKFYRTFVEEDRYKLILSGISTTLIITVCAILFGTICGFIVYLLSRKNRIVKMIGDALNYLVSGLPVVVLLMIMFYVVFANSRLDGTIISIVGFTLIFGCSVYGMLKVGVSAIDKGQFESALALGYTENQTLFKFIFPQAFRIVMPSYEKEIVQLIKSTSIVGYVTVQDITRVSDIIRSRTYDAFFPLIITAIIYFILAWGLMKLAVFVQKKLLPNEKTTSEILRNVGISSHKKMKD